MFGNSNTLITHLFVKILLLFNILYKQFKIDKSYIYLYMVSDVVANCFFNVQRQLSNNYCSLKILT